MININQSLLDIVAAFAVFVGGASALGIMYGGFLLIFSADNPQQEARGKAAIGLAIVGGVIVAGAVSIANLITTHIK